MNIIETPGSIPLPGPEGTVPLPVIRDPSGYYSYWKPTEKELQMLNSGCSIQLGIHHNVHPVVSMEVSFAIGENVKGRYSDETVLRVATAFMGHINASDDKSDFLGAIRAGLDAL
jgi:hypothetical protein